ncbi:MAG: TasA family protein [Patescibacteria group bacterium]|nr:M73 family metallopeptidase [Patescibacteria group bacterium]
MNPKKLLLGLLVLALGAMTIRNLTSALFTDTERTEDSTFTAGTLNINVDENDGTVFDNIVVSNIGVDGTVSGGKTWTINNTGSVPGNLQMQMMSVVNNENGCNEPEALVDGTCADPGPDQGELGGVVATVVILDDDATGPNAPATVVTSTLATADAGSYLSQWNSNAGIVTIPAGGSLTVTMNWSNNPASYGNEIQSDSLSFDVQFDVVQVTPEV